MTTTEQPEIVPGFGLATLLDLGAAVMLVGGMLAAYVVWMNFGTVEIQTSLYGPTEQLPSTAARAAAVGLAIQGALGSILFAGLAAVLRNTVLLREALAPLKDSGWTSASPRVPENPNS